MKFIANSKTLSTALQKAGKAINGKSSLPILNCFLFGIKDNKLHLAATDGEIRLTTTIEVHEAEGSIKFAVNAKVITDALKELPEQPITIEVNENNFEVFIHYHNGKFNFIGQSADDFPTPRELAQSTKKTFAINPETLLDGLVGTSFACADDELRPTMNGVYFDLSDKGLVFVASDGHKLVKLKSIETKVAERASFILPRKGANTLKSLLPKENEKVQVSFDLNQAVFKLSDFTIIVRFIEGRYANYESVIPQTFSQEITLSKSALSAAVKRISLFGNDQSNMIKLDIAKSTVIVSSQDLDFSTAAEETVECLGVVTPIQLGLKAAFFTEILNSIGSDEIVISLNNPSQAIVLSPKVNSFGFELTALLMPMMLND